MTAQPTENSSHAFIFQLDKTPPVCITLATFIFSYLLQYPLCQLLPGTIEIPKYDWVSWLTAYNFVLFSMALFISGLFVGLSGRAVKIYPTLKRRWQPAKRISMSLILAVLGLFVCWSYLMLNLKTGITIYILPEALPYRITGILFYGRLFVQPLILSYIALGYADSKLKWLLLLFFVALGAWVCLASGSRFVAIMFALPMFLLFKGKSRYLAFCLPLLTFIIIASLSRTFYLPFVIDDINLIRIYGNEEAQSEDSNIEKILLLPFTYTVIRIMGITEVLLTLNYGEITPSFVDSLQSFLSYFFPLITPGNSASFRNIYGLSDDAFGV